MGLRGLLGSRLSRDDFVASRAIAFAQEEMRARY